MNRFFYGDNIDDIGCTVVENVFINHYMPKARGDYVKVYLYALKVCSSARIDGISDEEIASALDLKPEEVQAALNYWENENAVKLYREGENTNVEFRSLSYGLFFDALDKDRVNAHIKPVTAKTKKMFERLEKVLNRPLTVTETEMFAEWLEDYFFTPDVVCAVVEDCVKRDNFSRNYWNGMAAGCHDAGVRNLNDFKNYIASRELSRTQYKEIMNYLGMYSVPSVPQKKLMDKWLGEYGFDIEKIKQAADETVKATKPSLKYVDSVLTAWHEGKEFSFEAVNKKSAKTVTMENDHNYSPEEIEAALFGKNLLKDN